MAAIKEDQWSFGVLCRIRSAWMRVSGVPLDWVINPADE
jgi:hypothetical protein